MALAREEAEEGRRPTGGGRAVRASYQPRCAANRAHMTVLVRSVKVNRG